MFVFDVWVGVFVDVYSCFLLFDGMKLFCFIGKVMLLIG